MKYKYLINNFYILLDYTLFNFICGLKIILFEIIKYCYLNGIIFLHFYIFKVNLNKQKKK